MLGSKFKRHAALAMPLFRHNNIITNLDLIVDSTDKLLANWRYRSSQTVHLDIVRQCQKLLLHIFGFIAFDYDLNTLDDDHITANNDLTQALQVILDLVQKIVRSPDMINFIWLKLNSRYQRAQAVTKRYFNQIIASELAQNLESIAQRKRTSLIASLISSLQQDEQLEARKDEEEKKGQLVCFKPMISFLNI